MRTGLMRRTVKIRTSGQTPDGGGGYTETAFDSASIPARIEPLQGSEMLRAMQTGIQRPVRITMRYRADLTAAQEIVYGTRIFDVKSVVDTEEKHRELIVLCDEVNAGTPAVVPADVQEFDTSEFD